MNESKVAELRDFLINTNFSPDDRCGELVAKMTPPEILRAMEEAHNALVKLKSSKVGTELS